MGVAGGRFMASQDRVKVHSSRVWALFHSFTRLIFPERIVADKLRGDVKRKSVSCWYIPWEGAEKHLPLPHVAQVDRDKGFFWDTVIVENMNGADPLIVHKVSKRKARRFVNTVNEWIGRANNSAPQANR
jgi:hypothetical protein